jgi:hypothetical protein
LGGTAVCAAVVAPERARAMQQTETRAARRIDDNSRERDGKLLTE